MSASTGADPLLLSHTDGRTVRWLLETRAAARADHPFLVWVPFEGEARTWTYGGFLADVDRLAVALRDRGIARGSRVAVHLDNRPEFLLTWFALHSLGAVLVSTNVKSSPAELADLLVRSDVAMVVTEARHLDAIRRARVPDAAIVLADLECVPPQGGPSGPSGGVGSFGALLRAGEGAFEPVALDPMAPAGIQFTSGTTSRPKGVVWTQANYVWAARVSAAHEHLRPDDRHYTYLPLFHTNAQAYSVMASLWVGATVVLAPRFSMSRFWSTATAHEATWASMIPFAMKGLRALPVPEHRFRQWGSPIVIPSWERLFGIPMVAWWGMTETVTHAVVSEVHSPRRPGAIGLAAPEYETRLRPDEAAPSADGSREGLLEVRGRRGVAMALGYLDDPDAEAAAWGPDGWFETGDRVRVHADGWVEFVEREKDVLKVGGENVGAAEIERVIAGVPGVHEVAVVGAPDPLYDEVPVAFVIPAREPVDDLADAVIAACRAELASFKVPREVRLVDDLPRVTLEKVAKAELRRALSPAVELG